MTNPDTRALQALADKVEAGLDTAHHHAAAFPSESAYGHCTWHDSHKASGGSLDAAKALHETVADDWTYIEMRSRIRRKLWVVELSRLDSNGEEVYAIGRSSIPARAWLLAILRALIAGGRDAQP